MEDDSTGRRYGTRATNKLFKVKDVLQPLRSPPKRKTRPAEEVAAEKIEKGLKKQRREEAQIAQEVAKKQLAEEIARVEDMHLRAQKAKQKVHPRRLGDTTPDPEMEQGVQRELAVEPLTSEHAWRLPSGPAKAKSRGGRMQGLTRPANAWKRGSSSRGVVVAQSQRTRAMSPDSSSNGTEADEPLPLPPSKKARLARQAAMSTVAKTNTVMQFEPTTPVVTRDQLTEANSHTIMETPGQVPSEDESEDDDRCDPDFVLTSMQHATASDSEDSYVEKPMQWQTPSDDDATPRASRLNLEGSTQEAGEVLGSQTTQTASKTNVVGKGKGKGKEKEKAPKIWEMIKATRREKDLINNNNNNNTISSSSQAIRAGKGLPGLIDNWKDHVTGTIATAQQPIKSTASVTTSSASPSCHTASISTTSVGPVRTAINEKRRSHTSQPYADPPHATQGTKQTLPSRPKPRPIRAAARVKKTTNNSNGNDDDDYREEDDDAFAAEYGGMHDEDDSKEQEFMRSSCSNVNQPKAMDIIKLETASPLPSIRRRNRIKPDDDAEPSTSNRHSVGQLPDGCLSAWASYFLPGVLKLQGARLEVWGSNSITTISDLQKLWDFNYGQGVKHNIDIGNPVFRGCDKRVTEWRSNIGSTGLASLQSLFDSNELNTEERQQLSSTLKQDDSWIYGTNPNTGDEELFWGPLVLQTFAQHISMIESAHHPADFDTVNNIELQHGAIALAAASVYRAICLWSGGHITCEVIDKNVRAFQADSRNGRSSLKKNLHLTKAIQAAEGSSKRDLEFNNDNYAPITDSFALLAMDAFDSVAKMEDYKEEAATYQASASKKPKALKAAKEKVAKMDGPAARFLRLPAVRAK